MVISEAKTAESSTESEKFAAESLGGAQQKLSVGSPGGALRRARRRQTDLKRQQLQASKRRGAKSKVLVEVR